MKASLGILTPEHPGANTAQEDLVLVMNSVLVIVELVKQEESPLAIIFGSRCERD